MITGECIKDLTLPVHANLNLKLLQREWIKRLNPSACQHLEYRHLIGNGWARWVTCKTKEELSEWGRLTDKESSLVFKSI